MRLEKAPGMYRWRPLAAALLMLGCHSSTSPLRDDAPAPRGLLEGSRSVLPSDPAMIRARGVDGLGVEIADPRSPDDAARVPRVLRLNLFEDATWEAHATRVGRRHGALCWRGEIPSDPSSRVRLALRGSAVSGSVRVDGRLFTIEPSAEGLVVIEWDESKTPPDAPALVPPAPLNPDVRARPAPQRDGEPGIDVLVLYTPEAARGAGGPDAVEATIALAIEEANDSLVESGVAARLSLLDAAEIAFDEAPLRESDAGFELTLARLATEGDGVLDGAPELRDALGADHVVLIVDHAGPYAGIGYQMTDANAAYFDRFAYSVVSRAYAAGHYTFAHELGHNLGANHDPANASGGYRHDSHGHQVPSAGYRTVMAYACPSASCGRVGRWSNPSLTLDGQPTGVVDVADNARTLNLTASLAAAFRSRPAPPPPPNARLLRPADGSTLPAGPVTFEWTDVDADAYYLMVGRAPGDDAYLRVHAGRATSLSATGLPQDGATLHVRLWTLRDLEWGYVDHVLTAHRGSFAGATIALPGRRLDSSWRWFAWRPVEGARAYRLQVGTERDPGRYHDREVEGGYALVLGLPVDGSEVVARLHTLGPDGWVITRSTHEAWRAPSYAAVLTAPANGARLGSSATFRWEERGARAHWMVVRTFDEVIATVPVSGGAATIDGLPTDGRDVMVILYSLGDDGWVATSGGYRSGP